MTHDDMVFKNKRGAMRALCAAVVLLLLSSCIHNAVSGIDRESGRAYGAGYTSVLYDSTNGLPTSEANAIVQTKEGFIWVGGYSGLIRYDGNTFKRYDSSTGISSVVCLFGDSKGRLWIGTNDRGVAYLKDEKFKFFGRDSELNSLSIRSMTEDEEGNIIVATTSGIAYIDGEDRLYAINEPQLNKEYVCELETGADGLVYGVTNSGAFFTIKNRRVSAFYNPEDKGMEAIYSLWPDGDNAGYVYLGTNDAVIYYGHIDDDISKYMILDASPQTTIKAVKKINGQLWVCSNNGIGYFDSDMNYTELYDIPMNNSVDHMMEDYEGNLWFTSSRQGLMKIVKNRFIDVTGIAKMDPMVVNSTYKLGNELYIATDRGLHILDSNFTEENNHLTEYLDGCRIRCIKRDGNGLLWFGTYSAYGLVSYDPSSGDIQSYNADNGLLSSKARMVCILSDGSMAVATNAGVNIMKDGRIIGKYTGDNGMSNLEILCIEEGPDGKLYFGSDGDGIYVANGTKMSRLGFDDGLDSEVILRIKEDMYEKGLYWIITSNSIAYMRDDRITTVKNFPYPNNFDIFFDDNGKIWIVSSNGIYVVGRDALLRDDNIEYVHFDMSSGLAGLATANSYSHLTDDGELYICNSTGVCGVNINEDADDINDINLSVPYITVDGEYINVFGKESITIPYTCRRLNIYANAFTYSLNDPHLSYMLEGFDDHAINLTKKDIDTISYTNLDGGTYVFTMSIMNTNTGKADKTIRLKIIKETAFYETVWFAILVFAAVLALVAGMIIMYFRKKTKKLKKSSEEKQKLVNEITNVFASCVDMKDQYTNGHSKRVAKYASMLAEKLGKTKEEIDRIYNIALLHDIGKISIPDNILNKPGRLTDEEYAVMKSHSSRGYEILKEVTIEPDLSLGAGFHHEKFDGTGYPNGLKGDEIPEVAQIITVADTFDAMYSTRPYRKQLPIDYVSSEIEKGAGTQFNPDVVKAFMILVGEGAFDDAKEKDDDENTEENVDKDGNK